MLLEKLSPLGIGSSIMFCGIVLARDIRGLCLGVRVSVCVLLLVGVFGVLGATIDVNVDVDPTEPLVIIDSPPLASSAACFLPPPNSPNNFCLPVFFRCKDPVGAFMGEGTEDEFAVAGDAGGNWACHLEESGWT